MLHQYLLGIMKYTFTWVLQDINSARGDFGGFGKGARRFELDRRFVAFNSRHSDSTFRRHRFSSGVAGLSGITALEFVPLLWQLMFVLGVSPDCDIVGGIILPLERRKRLVMCIFYVVTLRERLWKVTHTVAELDELDDVHIPL